MRIWIGKEMEGKFLGNMTIFLETKSLSFNKIIKFLELLKKHSEVTNIYLGAGRVDLKLDTIKSVILLKSIFEICVEYNLKITLETTDLKGILSIADMVEIMLKFNVQLINRIEVLKDAIKIMNNIINKLDDTKVALLSEFKLNYVTDITGVNLGMYKNEDKLIYEDEED